MTYTGAAFILNLRSVSAVTGVMAAATTGRKGSCSAGPAQAVASLFSLLILHCDVSLQTPVLLPAASRGSQTPFAFAAEQLLRSEGPCIYLVNAVPESRRRPTDLAAFLWKENNVTGANYFPSCESAEFPQPASLIASEVR